MTEEIWNALLVCAVHARHSDDRALSEEGEKALIWIRENYPED